MIDKMHLAVSWQWMDGDSDDHTGSASLMDIMMRQQQSPPAIRIRLMRRGGMALLPDRAVAEYALLTDQDDVDDANHHNDKRLNWHVDPTNRLMHVRARIQLPRWRHIWHAGGQYYLAIDWLQQTDGRRHRARRSSRVLWRYAMNGVSFKIRHPVATGRALGGGGGSGGGWWRRRGRAAAGAAVQGLAAYGVAMTCINTRPGRGF